MFDIESVVKTPRSQDIDLKKILSTIFKSPLFTQSNISKKHTNNPKLFLNKPSNKKAKKPVKKESHILKNLINKSSTEPKTSQVSVTRKKNANNFIDLYNNIIYAEAQNKITNWDVITCYYLFSKALSKQFEHYKKSNLPYASL
ncbi:11103_t:CDS:2 [Gigaspora margarita]|uniref:11103_t:CDS:1 n=1 Tax=Gigaspora margarita TaxID=4874 RepID=A0ABN7UWV6_GIGMA|nr:11103_t:CDS:2 [Gigaspora margarita]